jgi:protein-disulfide isomerase
MNMKALPGQTSTVGVSGPKPGATSMLLAAAGLAIALALTATAIATAQVPVTPTPQTPAEKAAAFLKQYETMPRVTVPVSRDGAAVLIVKFTDYQCPACAVTYRTYRPILDKYEAQFPGALKYVVKDFPLDNSCASWMAQPLHLASCEAAVGVALARAQNHGPELEDWYYTNQQLLTRDTVRKAANIIGNVTDFTTGYAAAMNQVKADIGLGRLLNVDSTPTFFINGTKVAMVLTPDMFDAAIGFELRKAGVLK